MPDLCLGKPVSNDDCDALVSHVAIASDQTAMIAVRTAGATSPLSPQRQSRQDCPFRRKFLVVGRDLARNRGVFAIPGRLSSVYLGLMASSSKALACSSVAVVRRGKVCSSSPIRSSLRHSVPRSESRSSRLCATWPSAVWPLPAFAAACGERLAGCDRVGR